MLGTAGVTSSQWFKWVPWTAEAHGLQKQKTVWKGKNWWDNILICKWWNKGTVATEMKGQANLKQWRRPKVVGAPNIDVGWMICGPSTFECLWLIMVVQLLWAKMHRLKILTWFDDITTRINLPKQNKLSIIVIAGSSSLVSCYYRYRGIICSVEESVLPSPR